MNLTLNDDIDRVDWGQLALVFQRAPLGERKPETLRRVFQNSGVRCFAWDGATLIGAGRAITDRISYAAIFDVVLLPEYQGKGIGRQIMNHLIEHAHAANVILHVVPGKEGFYQKLGFRRMKTAMGRFLNPEVQQRGGYIE